MQHHPLDLGRPAAQRPRPGPWRRPREVKPSRLSAPWNTRSGEAPSVAAPSAAAPSAGRAFAGWAAGSSSMALGKTRHLGRPAPAKMRRPGLGGGGLHGVEAAQRPVELGSPTRGALHLGLSGRGDHPSRTPSPSPPARRPRRHSGAPSRGLARASRLHHRHLGPVAGQASGRLRRSSRHTKRRWTASDDQRLGGKTHAHIQKVRRHGGEVDVQALRWRGRRPRCGRSGDPLQRLRARWSNPFALSTPSLAARGLAQHGQPACGGRSAHPARKVRGRARARLA